MAETACSYCSSTKVKIVDSYENRDVMVIHCLNCGRDSALDTENDQTANDAVSPPGRVPRKPRMKP